METKRLGIKFIETNDHEELSRKCAEVMIECLKNKPNALFCIATGESPNLCYEIFVQRVKQEKIDVSKLRIIKLDEWFGISMDDPATCEMFIKRKLLEPLNISMESYYSFNSNSDKEEEECKRITDKLKKEGPIDLCILGLGKNGHLGLNEPGFYLIQHSHITEIDNKTKMHSMLNKTNINVSKGITLGIVDIISSKQILFIVSGEEKREVFNEFLEGKIKTILPSSLLWLHYNTLCIFEKSMIF